MFFTLLAYSIDLKFAFRTELIIMIMIMISLIVLNLSVDHLNCWIDLFFACIYFVLSGIMQPGLNAILGPTGSGKTT